jgi:threonine/homoserine/homoserine lactone efflux protein
MFDASLFLKAAGVGVAIAAPVGPMSLLCMRTTLARGWRHGLAIGGGIALGDGAYACVAALGLAGVSRFMLAYERPLHAAAGLFLIYLGLKAFRAGRGADEAAEIGRADAWTRELATAALLTLTNPPTIISFAAVFTVLSPAGGLTRSDALATVAGVLCGSALWWCVVVAAVGGFRHALGRTLRTWIDRVAGAALALFGALELRRAL